MIKKDQIENKATRIKPETGKGKPKASPDRERARKDIKSDEIENKAGLIQSAMFPAGFGVRFHSHLSNYSDLSNKGSAFIGVVTEGYSDITSDNGTIAQLAAGQVFAFNDGLEIRGGRAVLMEATRDSGSPVDVRPFISDPVSDGGKTRLADTRIGYELIEAGTLRAELIYIPIGSIGIDILTGLSAHAHEKNKDIFPQFAVVLSGEIQNEVSEKFTRSMCFPLQSKLQPLNKLFNTPNSDARIIVFSLSPEI